jgi:hypothetical protein
MNRTYVLFTVLALLVSGVVATVASVADTPPENLNCSEKRVVVFGWTSKQQSMAELAAIAKWQGRVKSKLPDFDQWHQAFNRKMSCQIIKESSHYQCEVSAIPCHYNKS